MSGRRFLGPCGGEHEHIISQFNLCLSKACLGKPACPKCGSQKVAPFVSEQVPPGSSHCWTCGAAWNYGVGAG